MISESSANFIEGLVKDAEQQGAKLLTPYKREGNLIWPVLIDHVTQVSRLMPHASGGHAGIPCDRCSASQAHGLSCPARILALCAKEALTQKTEYILHILLVFVYHWMDSLKNCR